MDMTKRRDDMTPEQVQAGNRAWWTRNTMSYDWNDKVELQRFSNEWFDEIDARFVHASRLFATDQQPFDRLFPFKELAGAKVLEIGCGMGYHTELMARAGAKVTAFDLSDTSVEATTQRMKVRGLEARVMQGDAEALPFADGEFDFVWSWGVIHHSSRTGRIVRQIARVLSPGGSCRIMVYNRQGAGANMLLRKNYLMRLHFLRYSMEESLYRTTDGFSARYYVQEQFEDLFRTFFQDVSSIICGADSDAIPLPSRLRRVAMKFASEDWMKRRQARVGAFIFLTAARPN